MNIRTSHRVQGFRPSVSQERGAALIVALSVFLVLLSLAITFSLIVRYETQMTQQATSRALAERLLDGAMAQASSRLFWALYRRWVSPEMPEGGVDVFGCNLV